jgi:predicted metalloprotease with PDZ domain
VKRSIVLLVLLLLLAFPVPAQSAAAPAAPGVQYRVVLDDPAQHLLRIYLFLTPSPEAKVQLPVWNATYQVRDFSQYVLWLKARDSSGNAVATRKLDKTTWSVPEAREVEYEVFADQPGPFSAQLTSEHCFLNLADILMYPVGQKNAPMTVSFVQLPVEWKIATALPPASAANTFTARNYDHMVDSPVEIGSFHEADYELGSARYRVVVDAATGDFDMTGITDMTRRLAAAETEWMKDRPFDGYLFIYHFPRRPSGGGMEHAYSTAIDSPAERVKRDPLSLAGVTAHEFFHLWNVKRIRPQSLEPVDYVEEQYTRALWFSEGVTSTVADYIRVRAGFTDEKGYLEGLARAIRGLETRPAHVTQSAEESSLDTWYDKYPFYGQPDRSVSYYGKGEILGVLLDLAIRDVTLGRKSLRDVFHWMNENYARQGKFFPDSAGVQQAVEAVSGADFKEFFARYVAGVDPLPYDKYFATVGLRLEVRATVAPSLGLRVVRAPNQPATVASVEPGSDAGRAGIRAGDVIQEFNNAPVTGALEGQVAAMKPGDAVSVKIQSAGGPREISFKLGSKPGKDYALVEADGATQQQRSRRAAWIRGDSQP